MATLVLAAVGNIFGGPIGGAVGHFAGSAIDNAIFGGSPARTVEGPRLKDLAVQSSAYGSPIPILYGQARIAGNIIWSTGLIESREESTATSGGKGAPRQTTNTVSFLYSSSFAVALSGRSVHSVGRIWADGKLLRDSAGALSAPGEMRFYPGDEIQSPDPLIEADRGAGQVPAHRGLAYIVFEGLALAEFANRIPNLTFELFAVSEGSEGLDSVIVDISSRSGETAVASGFSTSVTGFVITRPMPARQALEALSNALPFAAGEAGSKILYSVPAAGVPVTIGAEELGARPFEEKRRARMEWRRGQELEQMRELSVQYFDLDRDYQPGVQRARRLQTTALLSEVQELPMVLTATDAKKIAETSLAFSWSRRDKISFSLPVSLTGIDPGDRVQLMSQGRPVDLLVEAIDYDLGFFRCEGVSFDSGLFESVAQGDSGSFPGQAVLPVGDTVLHALDLPPLQAADAISPNIYAAAGGESAGWKGGVAFISRDEGVSYQALASWNAPSIIGAALESLAAGPTAYWDEGNSVRIALLRGDQELESRPELAIYNGANAAVLGDEILQFRSAVLEPDGSYRLSGLLRGRRGTETFVGSHAGGERFVFLSPGSVFALSGTLSDVGKTVLLKAVSVNQSIDETDPQNFIFRANNLKPFSPVHVSARRNGTGDVTISWIRRARFNGEWIDGVDVPLGEETEAYEVDIVSGGNSVRTLTSAISSAVYGAGEQINDFGMVQSVLNVRIYQLSTAIGRGDPWIGLL